MRVPFVIVATLTAGLVLAPHSVLAGPGSAYYAPDAEGIFWFIHLADTHIGAESWETREDPSANLASVLTEGVQVVSPSFVVVTGDLTNGSANDLPTSGQDPGQWRDYRQIYTQAGMSADFYFDVIGNHDLYGDRGATHYLASSLQGHAHQETHFSWTRTTALGTYFFYGINTVGDYALPFTPGNGEVTDTEYEALRTALLSNAGADLQIVFGHHSPTGPRNSGRLADLLADNEAFYLHGHRHEYSVYFAREGRLIVRELNTLGKDDTSNIGIGAIDHHAFVYRPTSISKPWPMVVITAPVDRTLGDAGPNPHAYQVCKDRHDNPVRALVFSKDPPDSVTVQVSVLEPRPMAPLQPGSRIWRATVDTAPLAAGVYDVKVTATVGAETATDTIRTDLTPGPCASLTPDGGVPPADGGPPDPDGGLDGGNFPDAGTATDGGPEVDAGPSEDGGPSEDAGLPDAGTNPPKDGGDEPMDGGLADGGLASSDGGADGGAAAVDAGPGAGLAVVGRGCACQSGREAAGADWLGSLVLALAVLLGLRRRRRREAAR